MTVGRSTFSPTRGIPCDTCENRNPCKVHEMACDAFKSWAEHGVVKATNADRYSPTKAGLICRK